MLDRTKLTEKIGDIPNELMHQIESGLKAALGMA
jgi:mRNA-degrading endonuclease toxin of MazEF toxin-antitoxin module